MIRIFAIAASAMLLLSGCQAQKEARIKSALVDVGLSQSMAECMAQPLAQDLSTNQLKALGNVAKAQNLTLRELNERQVLRLLQEELDPQTVAVVARAGMGCFLRG